MRSYHGTMTDNKTLSSAQGCELGRVGTTWQPNTHVFVFNLPTTRRNGGHNVGKKAQKID